MSEDTTTPTAQDTVLAPEVEQPKEPETQAVQDEVETTSTDTPQTSEQKDSDEEILEWANKKGIKTDDPIAILRNAREAEQKMHQATKEAKALKNSVDTISEERGVDESVQLLNRLRVTDFYLNNPDARQIDDVMAQVVTEKPYLADDLDAVYEIAKYRNSQQYHAPSLEESRKLKLAQEAKAQVAGPPQASASTRETIKEVTDEDIARMSAEEYLKFKEETGFNPFTS
jgi:hypothetical protein